MLGTRLHFKVLKSLVVLGAALSLSGSAFATSIDFGKWYEFSFNGTSTFARGCRPADSGGRLCTASSAANSYMVGVGPWEFSAPAAGALFTVTDAFEAGDMFRIFDFGMPIGVTSFVSKNIALNCGSNPETCLLNSGISHASFVLAAGAHSIRIKPTASPYGSGSAYFRASLPATGAPEAATMLLLVAALLAFGILRRSEFSKFV